MRNRSLLFVLLLMVAPAGLAQAQPCACQGQPYGCHAYDPNCWWGLRCESGYCENRMWPAQYIPTARCSVNNAYTAMINNGWRRQNLLGDYHFEEGTNELTSAGKLKSQWILTQAPQDRRNIYVQRGQTQSDTASRIAAVHNWAGNQSPAVEPVLVNDTHIVAEGHTAGSVDSIFVGFQTNQPAPVLPPSTGGNGAGSTP